MGLELQQQALIAKPTKACCSSIPNQCRVNSTCAEDEDSKGPGQPACKHAACIAIQYWVATVGLNLNPGEMFTGSGGQCDGPWCEGEVCRTGQNTFTCKKKGAKCQSYLKSH